MILSDASKQSLTPSTPPQGGAGVCTAALAREWGLAGGPGELRGAVQQLEAFGLVAAAEEVAQAWRPTAEGAAVLAAGASPEFQALAAVPEGGSVLLKELKQALGAQGDVGVKQALTQKLLAMEKGEGGPQVRRGPAGGAGAADATLAALQQVEAGGLLDDKVAAGLKKRKLIVQETTRSHKLTKGPKFALQLKKAATDLTHDMLREKSWRDTEFKKYNFQAVAPPPAGGHLHPLLKVRTQFRKIFVQLGFEEMPTERYVESSFWNFDALFQPQQHPARDAHDTFFLTNPAQCASCPDEYLERVKEVHQSGGYGSIGYRYNWKRSESEKNLLRTHTTAVSSRMLEKVAQETQASGRWEPRRYFSIDRVFRNETVDKTHLAEFHQVEGLVADKDLSLGDLIGTIQQFFEKIGMSDVRFKPAYNPYTEPSMEIFAYHKGLGKWVEVGNSGVFRPEMLRPMGLPEDVNVIAWGLSLERPTMILYGVDNIRDLFGHKVDLSMIRSNPICRLGF